ncbi:MAG TPA: cytidine deaminase [Clostridiales bacterium]|nr:cytidine deaminase [Clostridiales bacterium]
MQEEHLISDSELVEMAMQAAENAYAPYSDFKVGAAVLVEDGGIYVGCNIENASFGATVCAERTAIFNAVSDGYKRIVKLAVASPLSRNYTMPCGICRQVALEFGGKDLPVLCADMSGLYKEYTLEQLLPEAFMKF